jgi:hypothetical protein
MMSQDFSGRIITQHLDTLCHIPMAHDSRLLSAVSGGYKTPQHIQKYPALLAACLVTSVIDQLCLQSMEEAI